MAKVIVWSCVARDGISETMIRIFFDIVIVDGVILDGWWLLLALAIIYSGAIFVMVIIILLKSAGRKEKGNRD